MGRWDEGLGWKGQWEKLGFKGRWDEGLGVERLVGEIRVQD